MAVLGALWGSRCSGRITPANGDLGGNPPKARATQVLQDRAEIFNLETHRRLFYMSRLSSNQNFGQIDAGYIQRTHVAVQSSWPRLQVTLPLLFP